MRKRAWGEGPNEGRRRLDAPNPFGRGSTGLAPTGPFNAFGGEIEISAWTRNDVTSPICYVPFENFAG